MAFDFKKEYKELFSVKEKPVLVTVPKIKYVAVRGKGDPNEEEGEYKASIPLLYGLAYTIKMSKKGSHRMEGYFDFVVPPLEGFWWQEGIDGVDYGKKSDFRWISVIQLPDFVTEQEFEWAREEASRKKKMDFSKAELLLVEEGHCVQCLHIGSYDEEPATIEKMRLYIAEQGYVFDHQSERMHHEIYLSDPRKCAPEKLKTIIRIPIVKIK